LIIPLFSLLFFPSHSTSRVTLLHSGLWEFQVPHICGLRVLIFAIMSVSAGFPYPSWSQLEIAIPTCANSDHSQTNVVKNYECQVTILSGFLYTFILITQICSRYFFLSTKKWGNFTFHFISFWHF
jgi:hypothetical protein